MGEIYALLCALLWAAAVIFFKKSGETVRPFALNLFRVGVSTVLLWITVLFAGQGIVREVTTSDLLVLVGGGILSIAVADTLFHKCLNTVGAGITAIVDCLYSPLMLLFAFLLLGEELTVVKLAGASLVVGGVFVASNHRPASGMSRGDLIKGMMYGAGAMTALTLGVVWVRPVLDNQPILWATAVRQAGALAFMVPLAALSPRRREWFGVFRPRADWKYSLTGTVLGSYLALVFWLAGMKYTQVGVAAILNQTSTIYVLVLATFFLKESFSMRKAAAAAMAVGGIVMVTVF